MAKIFYGEDDEKIYNDPSRYAYMNWWFDNGLGDVDKNDPWQLIHDNFILGKGYLGGAIMMLFPIVRDGNEYNVADIIIFPVMFSIWHGVELWLKSSILSLSEIYGTEKPEPNHLIYDLYGNLRKILEDKKLDGVIESALTHLDELVDEFKKVGARFDFARYSYDRNGNYQFYNAPIGDEKQWQGDDSQKGSTRVPNTRVDLITLFELVIKIFDSFGTFVECLQIMTETKEKLTNEDYDAYLGEIESLRELTDMKDEEDFWKILYDEIMNH